MEVLSPMDIYSNYNFRLMPLDINLISDATSELCQDKKFYFNGDTSGAGIVRVYARLVEPKNKNGKLLITLLEFDQQIDTFNVSPLLEKGYSVLILDYAGFKEIGKYTIYPKTLSIGNLCVNTRDFIPANATSSGEYLYGTILLRATIVAEHFNYSCYSLFGIGMGGGICYRMGAIIKDAKSITTLFSYKEKELPTASADARILNYKMGMMCDNISSFIVVPTLVLITSNEQNNSLDKMSKLALSTNPNCLFSICPKSNQTLNPDHYAQVFAFLEKTFNDTFVIPSGKNQATFFESSGSLYISVNGEGITNPTLYLSRGLENSSFRNWTKKDLEHTESSYFAKVKVCDGQNIIYGYFDYYIGELKLSTPVVSVLPKFLAIDKKPLNHTKIVYSFEEDAEPFLALKGRVWSSPNVLVEVKSGIKGVYSSNNSLTLLSFTNAEKSGHNDNLLQITYCSDAEQSLLLTFKDSTGNEFVCEKKVFKTEFWQRLTLSNTDFKGHSLLKYDSVASLTISASLKFLISGILWI